MKVGDKVRCITPDIRGYLLLHQEYVINWLETHVETGPLLCKVDGKSVMFWTERFEAINDKIECEPVPMASQLPATRMVDEFGFPLAPREKSSPVTMEDLSLIRGFLGNLKDQTLSRGIHRVLGDLLERLPK